MKYMKTDEQILIYPLIERLFSFVGRYVVSYIRVATLWHCGNAHVQLRKSVCVLSNVFNYYQLLEKL